MTLAILSPHRADLRTHRRGGAAPVSGTPSDPRRAGAAANSASRSMIGDLLIATWLLGGLWLIARVTA